MDGDERDPSTPTSVEQQEGASGEADTDVICTMITEAADGFLVANTISRMISALDVLAQDVDAVNNNRPSTTPAANKVCCATQSKRFLEPIPPSKFVELSDGDIAKIFHYLPSKDLRPLRTVCHKWKNILDSGFLEFSYILTRNSISFLENLDPEDIVIQKLTVCNLLDVELERLQNINLWSTVKQLEIESQRPENYENQKGFEQPTVGEKNLVGILKMASGVETLTMHNGSLGNFGLELLEINKDENLNEIVVGWQWPSIKVHESVTAVGEFLQKILGNLDETFGCSEVFSENLETDDAPHPSQIIPSDPPGVEITYKMNPPPPFPAFLTLAPINLENLETLSVTVQPTRNTEKIGLIAFLHVLTFPRLRSFELHSQEYIPDEALYRCVFRFILKHKNTLRKLIFTNPILSTNLANIGNKSGYLAGLDKIRLREMTVAWDVPVGLEMYWSNGHYMLESQRRLRKLEFHTTNTLRAAGIVLNNFRFLTEANIDVTDSADREFDCSCFQNCARLQMLTLHVVINVKITNVNKLPDTIEFLHWDALYTREDIRWFSRFLILAKGIFLYHDKDTPMDTFAPFNFTDFMHFIRLPCLEQLHLPRIHVQDPRVTRFCADSCVGVAQQRDLFLINRKQFVYHQA